MNLTRRDRDAQAAVSDSDLPLVSVRGLHLTADDGTPLVEDLTFEAGPGQTLGIVGESGSGKSLTLRSMLGIQPSTVRVAGEIRCPVRTAMIFQEPATALNPTMRVGDLVAQVWRRHHQGTSRADADAGAVGSSSRSGSTRRPEGCVRGPTSCPVA